MANPLLFYLQFFIFSVLAFSCKSGEKVLLKLNPKVGDKYYISSISNLTTTQEVENESNMTEQKINVSYFVDVENVEKNTGNITLKLKYDRLSSSTRTNKDSSSFSLAEIKDTSNLFFKTFRLLKTSSIILTLKPNGEVLTVNGIDDIFENIQKSFPVSKDTLNNNVLKFYKSLISTQNIKSGFTNGWNIYPGNAIAEGESWNIKRDLGFGLNGEVSIDYTVKEISPLNVSIGVKTTSVLEKKIQMGNGIELTTNGKGTGSGSIVIDRETGFVLNSIVVQTMTGTSKMIKNKGKPFIWPIKVISTTSINLSKR